MPRSRRREDSRTTHCPLVVPPRMRGTQLRRGGFSIPSRIPSDYWIAPPSRAMTVEGDIETCNFTLAARSARAMPKESPRQSEGAGNVGCALHPPSRVQKKWRKTHTSIQVSDAERETARLRQRSLPGKSNGGRMTLVARRLQVSTRIV